MFTAGSNERPLDFKPNVLPTELGGLICRVEFKLLLTVLFIATMLYVAVL